MFGFFKKIWSDFQQIDSSEPTHTASTTDSLQSTHSVFYDDMGPMGSSGVNPANGLPMIGGGLDIEGNIYGTSNDDHFGISHDPFDMTDPFNSINDSSCFSDFGSHSSFDDPFS